MALPFADRAVAGRLLAQRLAAERIAGRCVVVALPRGGAIVGAEVARRLQAPLDLLLVRKIGAPWQQEFAVAAVVDGRCPVLVVDDESCSATGADSAYLDRETRFELIEIERRRQAYLQGRAPLELQGVTAIVVDDGIATGTTMRAALKALRSRRPAHIVVAVPVAAHDSLKALRPQCDRVVCLLEAKALRSVGMYYSDFHQVTDEEVVAALHAAPQAAGARRVAAAVGGQSE